MADEQDDSGFLKNKKILGAAGGGVLGFTTVVFAYIDSKTDMLDKRIDDKYVEAKAYVDTKHDAVKDKLNKIETILVKIDDRVYELTKKER